MYKYDDTFFRQLFLIQNYEIITHKLLVVKQLKVHSIKNTVKTTTICSNTIIFTERINNLISNL